MKNEIKLFNSPEFGQVRTIIENDDEILFNAKDVCDILGYVNARDALSKHVYEDDVAKRYAIDSVGRKQEMNYVTEEGLYALIFGSTLEIAKQFKKWAAGIIKQIRKKEIQELKEENKRLLTQAPFPVCKKSISMQSFANFLTTYTGEKIGRTTLFAICRKLKYIQIESTKPYQKYINNGFFEVAVKDDNVVPLVTPKGQVYMSKRIHKLCSKNKILSYPLF